MRHSSATQATTESGQLDFPHGLPELRKALQQPNDIAAPHRVLRHLLSARRKRRDHQLDRLSSNEMKIAPRSVRIAVGASSRSAANCMVASRLGDKQPHSARMPVVIRRLMGSRKSQCGRRPNARRRKAAPTGKQSTHAPVGSAGVMDAARWDGDAGKRGRPVQVGGRDFNAVLGGGLGGSRTGSYDR
jgi:hypothetical protein